MKLFHNRYTSYISLCMHNVVYSFINNIGIVIKHILFYFNLFSQRY